MEPIATFRTARALARMVGLAPIAAQGFVLINTTDQTVPPIALVRPPTLNCINVNQTVLIPQ